MAALTTRKAMTANDTLILPYSLSEVNASVVLDRTYIGIYLPCTHPFIDSPCVKCISVILYA